MHQVVKMLAFYIGLTQCAAATMDYKISAQKESGGVYLNMSGAITSDDEITFSRIINSFGSSPVKIIEVRLNSNGGEVDPALAISRIILEKRINTRVQDGAMCISACVLLFGSGENRVAEERSTIGVHRASNGMQDNAIARSKSIEMLEWYDKFGFPMNVSYKMISTKPGELYYFSSQDKIDISRTTVNRSELDGNLVQAGVVPKVIIVTENDRVIARKLNDTAVDHIRSGQFDLAVSELEKAKYIYPADSEVLGNLGYAYFNQGNFSLARDNLLASLKLKPNRAVSWNNLGLVLGALNQVQSASECFMLYWGHVANKNIVLKQFDKWESEYKGTEYNGIYEAVKIVKSQLGLYVNN